MQGYLQNIRQYSFYARVRMSQSLRKDHPLCIRVLWKDPERSYHAMRVLFLSRVES